MGWQDPMWSVLVSGHIIAINGTHPQHDVDRFANFSSTLNIVYYRLRSWEIIRLVASIRPSNCLSVCLWTLSCLSVIRKRSRSKAARSSRGLLIYSMLSSENVRVPDRYQRTWNSILLGYTFSKNNTSSEISYWTIPPVWNHAQWQNSDVSSYIFSLVMA